MDGNGRFISEVYLGPAFLVRRPLDPCSGQPWQRKDSSNFSTSLNREMAPLQWRVRVQVFVDERGKSIRIPGIITFNNLLIIKVASQIGEF